MLRPQKTLGPAFPLLGLLVVLASHVYAGEPPPAPPLIRSITIEGNVRTRTEVIHRELLFSQGEPLDSSLVAETERNLRRLLYLGKAEIRILEANGAADVTVEVEDLYSRAFSPRISGEPGELSYGLIALDYNLLGRGQTAEVKFHVGAPVRQCPGTPYHCPKGRFVETGGFDRIRAEKVQVVITVVGHTFLP